MPTYYTVVQCVPDPIANERINVGVIVVGDGQLRCRFLSNWDRVAQFAHEDVGYVREFAEQVEQAAAESAAGSVLVHIPGLPGLRGLDATVLQPMIGEWRNCIQLTPAQPSLESPDALLINMAETFLGESTGELTQFRDRQTAARLALESVRRAVGQRVSATDTAHVVRADYQVAGRVIPRLTLDLAIRNEGLCIAIRALSFETDDIPELDRQIREAIFTLRDVGDRHERVRLYLIALPPREDQRHRHNRQAQERLREVQQSCRQIEARLVLESGLSEWAEEIATMVETEIVQQSRQVARA